MHILFSSFKDLPFRQRFLRICFSSEIQFLVCGSVNCGVWEERLFHRNSFINNFLFLLSPRDDPHTIKVFSLRFFSEETFSYFNYPQESHDPSLWGKHRKTVARVGVPSLPERTSLLVAHDATGTAVCFSGVWASALSLPPSGPVQAGGLLLGIRPATALTGSVSMRTQVRCSSSSPHFTGGCHSYFQALPAFCFKSSSLQTVFFMNQK